MTELRGRALIESRFGPVGHGCQRLAVKGRDYTLDELLFCLGLNFEDSRGIDLVMLSENHYVVRYYDGDDQRVVAHEFDADLGFLGETRAHIAEWIGEEAYFEWFKHVRVHCPADV